MRNIAIAMSLLTFGLLASTGLTARADDFTQNFHEGCLKSVTSGLAQKGVTVDNNVQKMASNYCDCAQNKVQSSFTPAELQSLSQPNPDPSLIARMQPIKQQCSKENFHQ